MERIIFPALWSGRCVQCHETYDEEDPIVFSPFWLDHIHPRCFDDGPDGMGEHIGRVEFVPPMEFRSGECA